MSEYEPSSTSFPLLFRLLFQTNPHWSHSCSDFTATFSAALVLPSKPASASHLASTLFPGPGIWVSCPCTQLPLTWQNWDGTSWAWLNDGTCMEKISIGGSASSALKERLMQFCKIVWTVNKQNLTCLCEGIAGQCFPSFLFIYSNCLMKLFIQFKINYGQLNPTHWDCWEKMF